MRSQVLGDAVVDAGNIVFCIDGGVAVTS